MKITEHQLKKLTTQQSKLAEAISQIGFIESQKHMLLHEVALVNKEVEELKVELEQEYGKISIDLSTGEYTIVEEDEPNTEN
jgi:hypothetical protein